MAEFNGEKGRWITTKKKHRHVFIPDGKDAGEVLKEMFGKYNDDDYDFYEDGDEEEYQTYDGDYEEEFGADDDNKGTPTLDKTLKDRVLKGEITLDDAAKELNKAGWYNFKPSEEETKKVLGLNDDDKPYDFDKWAKETNSDKTKHAGYLDTNKTYTGQELMDIFEQDDQWDTVAGGGLDDNVWFKHKSGANYVWNRNSGKIKLLSDNDMKKYKGFEEDDTIDYDTIEYPKGTSKEYSTIVNNKYQKALPVLEKAGIKLSDFGGKPSAEGGYEDNSKEIMDKYVFEPFRAKYPKGNNDAWEKEYQPLYDAIDAVLDKNYNDWYIKNTKK